MFPFMMRLSSLHISEVVYFISKAILDTSATLQLDVGTGMMRCSHFSSMN